jgi:hypothetical protein
MIDWTKTPRGKAVRGAHKLAEYIFGDGDAHLAVRALPRSEFGIQILNGQLVGFSGWLDAALAERAGAGGKKQYRRERSSTSDAGEAA